MRTAASRTEKHREPPSQKLRNAWAGIKKPGDVWRLNLNRCGGKTDNQFSQWARGTEKQPELHMPGDFGFVHVPAEKMPF
jgi:hypothetical protein